MYLFWRLNWATEAKTLQGSKYEKFIAEIGYVNMGVCGDQPSFGASFKLPLEKLQFLALTLCFGALEVATCAICGYICS